MIYRVSIEIYDATPTVLKHSCQICDKPFEDKQKYYYIKNTQRLGDNYWVCSEICSEMLCLSQASNYRGAEWVEDNNEKNKT